ncbi:MAG: iron-containing alcohol dehydrogenase [Pirellulales bacterium]|nr:iron-containing alcohol dehydrogenase [Pirellulales bacterium]
MDDKKRKAHDLLRSFKGDNYIHGLGCLNRLGEQTKALGRRATVVADGLGTDWAAPIHEEIRVALASHGFALAGEFIPGAAPNAPREDVFRIAQAIALQEPDVVIAVGGGSGIDAVKAAVAYHVLGDLNSELMDYFGTGQVTAMLEKSDRRLLPVVAVQLAASSAAHLTQYSNITYKDRGQKLLIVDEAVVPPKALFDYTVTRTMPSDFTMDGGLDGVAHCLEVYFGAPDNLVNTVKPVALLGIYLIVSHLDRACRQGDDMEAREALGLGTDLGGYAIMLGGTNGAHLTSFSLVDILSHGRACAIMNPYYTVFFAPAIEEKVRNVGALYKAAGYTSANLNRLHGRDLGVAVAEAMRNLSEWIGFPTRLADVPGFTDEHLERAMTAAKNPKLESKLRNMPVPLSAEMVDEYMGPVLEAAKTGNFAGIKSIPMEMQASR